MKRHAVINVVGLCKSLLGSKTPYLQQLARQGAVATIVPAFPAVTCTAQSNYLTGRLPREHGIVGNGWFNRSLAEVQFWKQSNHLVQAPKIWEDLRRQDPAFQCAQLFWWFNMYSSADFSITPRPMYPADGRKIFDIYTWPFSLRNEIKKDLGEFPFPAFWGPAAGVASRAFAPEAASRWIADAAIWIENRLRPTLSLIYLPHLDYNLQRLGPRHPLVAEDLRRIDDLVQMLVSFFEARSVGVLILSEYGLETVSHPVHLNRIFRQRGWLSIKEELGLELLDCGSSKAFCVADHQVAHVYLNDRSIEQEVHRLLAGTEGVERVIPSSDRASVGLDHERAGDFVVVARGNSWFTYYYWLDDAVAPDFARTVDIHRKPGYDPVELFLDPEARWVKAKIGWRLLQKKLGFRMLMDVVALDANLVKGSHGRVPEHESDYPVLLAESSLIPSGSLASTDIYGIIRRAVLG